MMITKLHTTRKNSAELGSFTAYLTALVLLLVSAVLLWSDNQEIPTDSTIVYWSLGINILFWGKYLTVPLAWVCIFFWAKDNDDRFPKWKLLTFISVFILLFLVLASVHYVFAWAGSSLANVGTTRFGRETYHLARRVRFDESSKYYLGRCTSTKQFQCNFHQIFITNSHYRPNAISLTADQNTLSVVVDSALVYTYDGLRETCFDGDLVYCP